MQTRRYNIDHTPTFVERIINDKEQPKIARYNTMFVKPIFRRGKNK